MTDPDRIRQDIEQTQGRLSSDVDALAEKVTPGRIVERRVDRARETAGRWKESVMGSHEGDGPGLAGHAQNATQQVGEQASGLASDAAGALSQAPGAARRRAQGNPLAAGLVAFGAGWLVASLLPASQRERQLGEQAQQRGQQLAQPLAAKAKEVAADLQQPAQQAAQQVRETAQGAAQTVAETGRDQVGHVQERAQAAPANVQQNAH